MPKWERWLDDEDDEFELKEEYTEIERIRRRPKKTDEDSKPPKRDKKRQKSE